MWETEQEEKKREREYVCVCVFPKIKHPNAYVAVLPRARIACWSLVYVSWGSWCTLIRLWGTAWRSATSCSSHCLGVHWQDSSLSNSYILCCIARGHIPPPKKKATHPLMHSIPCCHTVVSGILLCRSPQHQYVVWIFLQCCGFVGSLSFLNYTVFIVITCICVIERFAKISGRILNITNVMFAQLILWVTIKVSVSLIRFENVKFLWMYLWSRDLKFRVWLLCLLSMSCLCFSILDIKGEQKQWKWDRCPHEFTAIWRDCQHWDMVIFFSPLGLKLCF